VDNYQINLKMTVFKILTMIAYPSLASSLRPAFGGLSNEPAKLALETATTRAAEKKVDQGQSKNRTTSER